MRVILCAICVFFVVLSIVSPDSASAQVQPGRQRYGDSDRLRPGLLYTGRMGLEATIGPATGSWEISGRESPGDPADVRSVDYDARSWPVDIALFYAFNSMADLRARFGYQSYDDGASSTSLMRLGIGTKFRANLNVDWEP